MPAPPESRSVNFNYVIPERMRSTMERYCSQHQISTSRLVRRLILEYIEGDLTLNERPEHPLGKRTSVTLPERLLHAFETKIEEDQHSTKAAVIAALMAQFLPGRVLSPDTETVRIEADLPTDVFSTIYGAYGPGPIDQVIVRALTILSHQSKLTKESV